METYLVARDESTPESGRRLLQRSAPYPRYGPRPRGNRLFAVFGSSGSMKRMLDVTDYELVWPPELFAAEAGRVLAREKISMQAVDLLLREAFRDDSAAEDAAAAVAVGTWSSGPGGAGK